MDSSHSNILQLKQQKFSGTEFDFEPNTPNEALTQVCCPYTADFIVCCKLLM